MKPEDRSKLRSLLSDASGLKSRSPDAKKFKDWKRDVEKKLGETFGNSSDEVSRFKRIRFFDFEARGRDEKAPLNEADRSTYIRGIDEAQRFLQRLV